MKKTVLITGGSKGIGKGIVEAFAKEEYNVVFSYNKSLNEANKLTERLKFSGINVETFKADVCKRNEVNNLVDFCISKFGRVDVLVNNAGISSVGLFTEITDDNWNKVIDTNLKGVFNVTQEVLNKSMIKNKSGRIINISSIWGITGGSCEVAYSASKAGVIGLTKSLAKELILSNITVNTVAPGAVITDMLLENDSLEELEKFRPTIPMGRFGEVEEIASAVIYLASENAGYITGQVISPNGGMVI